MISIPTVDSVITILIVLCITLDINSAAQVLKVTNLCHGSNRNITMDTNDTLQINFDMRVHIPISFPHSCGCAIESNAPETKLSGTEHIATRTQFLAQYMCTFGCITVLTCSAPEICSTDYITEDRLTDHVDLTYYRFTITQETARPDPSKPFRQDIVGNTVFTASINLELNIRCREDLGDYEPQYPITTISTLPTSTLTTSLFSESPQTTHENSVNSTVMDGENETKEERDSKSSIAMTLGIVIGILAALGIILVVICFARKRKSYERDESTKETHTAHTCMKQTDIDTGNDTADSPYVEIEPYAQIEPSKTATYINVVHHTNKADDIQHLSHERDTLKLKQAISDEVDLTYTDVIPNHRVFKNTANGSEIKHNLVQGSDAEHDKMQGLDIKHASVVFEDNELYVAGKEPTENMYDLAGHIYDTALPVEQKT